ncbi:MAG: hypothetical protein QCI38_05225 [Candidatus Thermoplasmatota archaeon]|nr:hypothetical protein [Candidatus Thermoplasmatota archaeon]
MSAVWICLAPIAVFLVILLLLAIFKLIKFLIIMAIIGAIIYLLFFRDYDMSQAQDVILFSRSILARFLV